MSTGCTKRACATRQRAMGDGTVGLLLAGVVLTIGAWWIVGGVCGVYHDDAIYVITAKALSEGEGYRLVNLPGQPYQTKYPILLPALLSLVWWAWPTFPDNLVAMQGLCLGCGSAAVGLAYVYLVRHKYFSRKVAAAAVLLCSTAPVFVYYGTLTLSEMPFGLLVVLVCWGFDAARAQPRSGRLGQLLLGVLLILPFWCRTVGIALVPAGLLLLHRGGRPTKWVAAGALTGLVPWVMWLAYGLAARQADPVEGYYTNYVGWWSSLGLPVLLQLVTSNTAKVIWTAPGLGLYGMNQLLLQLGVFPMLLLMLLLGIVASVPFVQQCRQGRVLPTMLAAYVLLVVLWPWPPDRFMVPILPMLVGYLLVGVAGVCRHWVAPRVGGRLAVAALGLALAANVICLQRYRKLSHETGYPQNRIASKPVRWESYQELFAWLRARTPPEAVVAAELDPMFYLYTARKGFRPFVSRPGAMFYGAEGPVIGTVDELSRTLQTYRPDYLVLSPMQAFDEPYIRLVQQLRGQNPAWLKRVYQDSSDARFAIYRVELPARSGEAVSSLGGSSVSAAVPD